MKQCAIASRRETGVGILLLALCAAGGPPPVHGQLRQIATEVRISAPKFVDNNDPARLRQIATAAAVELAVGAQGPEEPSLHRGFGGIFKFLDWQPAAAAAEPAARLVLDVLQDDSGLGSKIYLRYSAAIGGGDLIPLDPIKMLQLEGSTLYTGLELDFPSHDPDKLERDLKTKIREHYQAQTVQEYLEEHVLSKILLADDLDFDTERKKLVLPESTRQLKASEKSLFKVELVAANLAGQLTPGRMIVAPLLPPPDHRAMIHFFRFDQVLVKDDEKSWHPDLARILPLAREDNQLWVYMQHYEPDLEIGTSPAALPPPEPERDVDF